MNFSFLCHKGISVHGIVFILWQFLNIRFQRYSLRSVDRLLLKPGKTGHFSTLSGTISQCPNFCSPSFSTLSSWETLSFREGIQWFGKFKRRRTYRPITDLSELLLFPIEQVYVAPQASPVEPLSNAPTLNRALLIKQLSMRTYFSIDARIVLLTFSRRRHPPYCTSLLSNYKYGIHATQLVQAY